MAKQDHKITFSSEIPAADLTKKNIAAISNVIAQSLAEQSSEAIKGGKSPDGFHIRIGHSRSHSKTSDHKNVSHSKWGGGGKVEVPLI